ncbi:unnamed protein product [Durusdinium trenchii]|uniref:Uncharacterized protein n=1 Tax=Durusdinium trenchii TaxID=1381693 RepID=A0ABP0L686_9DINO
MVTMAAMGGVVISEEHGMGESTMMAFIHEHLQSILEPFTESVNELHGVVNALVVEMEAIPAHDQLLKEHSKMIRVAQAQLVASKQRIADVQDEQHRRCSHLERHAEELDAQLQQVKSHCEEVDQQHRESRSFLWDLQQSASALELRRSETTQEKEDTEQMQKELESLQKEVHRLSSRHQEALESNSKFQARLEQQKDAWETFLANHGRQRRQEELRMKDLRSELGEAKKGVGDGKVELRHHMLSIKSLQEELSTLSRRHQQTMRMQVVQERKQLESDERQATFVERLELLKADIQNVMDSLGLTEGAANLVETVNSLMQSSGEHAAGLQELRQRSDAHMAHLETLQSRADGAVKEAELLKQKDQEIEEIFLEKIEDLRNSMGLNVKRDQEEFRKEVDARTRGDAECLAKLVLQEEETLQLRDSLAQQGLSIEAPVKGDRGPLWPKVPTSGRLWSNTRKLLADLASTGAKDLRHSGAGVQPLWHGRPHAGVLEGAHPGHSRDTSKGRVDRAFALEIPASGRWKSTPKVSSCCTDRRYISLPRHTSGVASQDLSSAHRADLRHPQTQRRRKELGDGGKLLEEMAPVMDEL